MYRSRKSTQDTAAKAGNSLMPKNAKATAHPKPKSSKPPRKQGIALCQKTQKPQPTLSQKAQSHRESEKKHPCRKARVPHSILNLRLCVFLLFLKVFDNEYRTYEERKSNYPHNDSAKHTAERGAQTAYEISEYSDNEYE